MPYITFFKILDKCSMTQKQRIMIPNACWHKTARGSASGITKKPCVGASAHTRFRQSRLSLSSACPMQPEFGRIPFLLKLNNKGYFVQKYPWQGSGESRQIQISIFEQNINFVQFRGGENAFTARKVLLAILDIRQISDLCFIFINIIFDIFIPVIARSALFSCPDAVYTTALIWYSFWNSFAFYSN